MPLAILGGGGGSTQKKQRSQKWPPSILDEHEFILTNKRSILTNSGLGIPFLTFIFLTMNSRLWPQTKYFT